MEKKLTEKWPCAEAGHKSGRAAIRYSALETAKETPKESDADERSCDLGYMLSLARDFRESSVSIL